MHSATLWGNEEGGGFKTEPEPMDIYTGKMTPASHHAQKLPYGEMKELKTKAKQ